ncbi:Protein of unknown function [Gryllus bimaculatus]|nr:Protein of unknown function [Gryllus bimaculatus]
MHQHSSSTEIEPTTLEANTRALNQQHSSSSSSSGGGGGGGDGGDGGGRGCAGSYGGGGADNKENVGVYKHLYRGPPPPPPLPMSVRAAQALNRVPALRPAASPRAVMATPPTYRSGVLRRNLWNDAGGVRGRASAAREAEAAAAEGARPRFRGAGSGQIVHVPDVRSIWLTHQTELQPTPILTIYKRHPNRLVSP